jgi:DNA-binding CsgD family transcriptional regulator
MGIIVKFTGEEKVKIIDMFKSGFSLKEIADILKRHQSSIGRFLRKKGFKTNSYFGKDTSGVIAKLYEEGKSLNDIAKILNINIISAYNHCLKNNIKMRPVGSKLDISNKDFFKNLNKDSAYMLGLFIADGSLSQKKKRVALSLKLEDKYLIEKFKELIGSDHKINICRNMSAITVQDDYFLNTLVD